MQRLRRRLKWKKKPLFLKTSYWTNRLVEGLSKQVVMQGPFAGTIYIPGIPGDSYGPQLLGTYELEVHEALAELSKYPADLVVNVGAGEGFYAVGFARMIGARVAAFESSAEMRDRLAAMAAANGVEGLIDVHGSCDVAALTDVLEAAKKALVVMDIDGGEAELLDPVHLPTLRQVAILVETHDMFVPEITDTLIERFKETHTISKMVTRSRRASDLPKAVSPLLRPLLGRAMREHRGAQQAWLLMLPADH